MRNFLGAVSLELCVQKIREADGLLPCRQADSTLTGQHQIPHLSKVLLDWALVSHYCFCDYHFL